MFNTSPDKLEVQSHSATIGGYLPPLLDYLGNKVLAMRKAKANAEWNFCNRPVSYPDEVTGKRVWIYGDCIYVMESWDKGKGIMIFAKSRQLGARA